MGEKFDHLSYNDRLTLSRMLKLDYPVKQIAQVLGVDTSTIYRERKRCTYVHTNSDLTTVEQYNPDGAEERYRKNLKAKGPELKIGNDIKYAKYLEKKIKEDSFSPAAALACAELDDEKFSTTISIGTLYNYIYDGVLDIKLENLPQKGRKKPKRGHQNKRASRASAGTSIEKRPKEVDDRIEFGHWEMDTVKGKKNESHSNLLVLTERKTRSSLSRKMDDGKAVSVIEEIDKLEKELGDNFYRIFRSITVDNGVEFSDPDGMESSLVKEEPRTKVYYCHPYSSYERGSNENENKLVRRWIPKGTDFDDMTDEEIEQMQSWINDYPRRLFGYKTSGMMFLEELRNIGVDVDVGINLLKIKYTEIAA